MYFLFVLYLSRASCDRSPPVSDSVSITSNRGCYCCCDEEGEGKEDDDDAWGRIKLMLKTRLILIIKSYY